MGSNSRQHKLVSLSLLAGTDTSPFSERVIKSKDELRHRSMSTSMTVVGVADRHLQLQVHAVLTCETPTWLLLAGLYTCIACPGRQCMHGTQLLCDSCHQ